MSQDAMADDGITVETDGVTVHKTFEPDEFSVPTIKFEISSEREEAVRLRLADEIPDGFPMDGVGFHPEYESDNWTAYKDNRVEFTRTIDGGGSLTTVYGIRITASDDAQPFLVEPTLETAAEGAEGVEPDSVGEIVPEERTELVREFISGARETVPGLDEETDEDGTDAEPTVNATDPSDEPLALGESFDESPAGNELRPDGEMDPAEGAGPDDDPSASATSSGTGSEQDEEREDPDGASERDDGTVTPSVDAGVAPAIEETESDSGGADDGSGAETPDDAPDEPTAVADDPVATLAAEIRSGTAADEDLAVLREALGESDGTAGSTATQLRHLQSRVSELEAYADAFEEFIDENGTGERLVDDMQGRIEDVETDLDDTVEWLEATTEEFDEVRGTVETLDERIETVADDQRAALESIEDELGADVEAVRSDLNDLREHVEEINEWRDQLGEVFG